MHRPKIITHRGLEPTKKAFFSESTLEAFKDHLQRGFGLEFDLNFTKDGIVICHDATLKRLTKGKDERKLSEITTAEAIKVKLEKGRLGTFTELMDAAAQYPEQTLAVHFKGAYQTQENINTFLRHMDPYKKQIQQILLFDATPQTARGLKKHFPDLQLAASVSHPYDIQRYQDAAKGTLLSLEELLLNKDLYNWAWLDEWDLAAKNPDGSIDAKGKKLYNREVFDLLRKNKFKIALVTPELHGTSPGLLGGEAHPDAKDRSVLFKRIGEIIKLAPDALCTDFPEEVRVMSNPL